MLSKHSQMLDTGCLHGGKKYICKKLEVKEGGGCLLEGGVFLGAYGKVNLKITVIAQEMV